MPMPPNVNPYDPRKNRLQQPAQPQAGQQISTHDKKLDETQEVQSNLPPVSSQTTQPAGQPQTQTQPVGQPQQQTKPQQRKDLPVSYQQQAGAVVDPRYSAALAGKLQEQVQQQQQQLAQQQAAFQQQLQTSQQPNVSQTRIGELLNKITSGAASPQEISEYDAIQKMQFAGPTGLEKTANIAALSQLAQSPELLAQQYGGFGGGMNIADIRRSLGGSAKGVQLQQATQAASQLSEQAAQAQEQAEQQSGLLKSQTEALKKQAETGVKASQSKFLQELKQQSDVESKEKDKALEDLKNAIYLDKSITKDQLKNIQSKLGITDREISEMGTLQLGRIEGLGSIKDLKQLGEKVKELKESNKTLTPEQQNLISFYDDMENTLKRSQDVSGDYSAASKDQLAKINALRKLTGETELTEEQQKEVGKAYDPTKIASLGSGISRMTESTKDSEEAKKLSARYTNLDRAVNSSELYDSDRGAGLNGAVADLFAAEQKFLKSNPKPTPTKDWRTGKVDDSKLKEWEKRKQFEMDKEFTKVTHKMAKSGDLGQEMMNRAYGWYNEQGRKDPLTAMKKLSESVLSESKSSKQKVQQDSAIVKKGLKIK